MKYLKKMKKILNKILPYVFWAIILSWLIIAPIISEDPPKDKPKKDTVSINVKQMKEINIKMKMQNRMLDSLIIQMDTLIKKK